ncbi:ribose-phosphate pyrophosphokinase [Candidatus Dependentiae bacterium]|nr:ribose-phosphate pyrophosphokinase [Candidatus Dependentiae bacterium]
MSISVVKKNPKIVLFKGSAHTELADAIARQLKIKPIPNEIKHFADGETYVQFQDSFRGDNVFIIQPTCRPVNDNLMELLLAIDAARRASAGTITAVIPYFGYARQDRKDKPRVPISAKLVANLITEAGADRIITIDLHIAQLQGFFDIPLDHISAKYIIADYFLKKYEKQIKNHKVIVVSPDAGGVERARNFAKQLKVSMAIIDKRRPEANKAEIMNIIGDVKGKTAILFDDMIDTGGTMCAASDALLKQGAIEVVAACSHPVFSGKAITNLINSSLKEIVSTNTLPLSEDCKKHKKFVQLSVAPLIAGAIKCVQNGASMKILFSKNYKI